MEFGCWSHLAKQSSLKKLGQNSGRKDISSPLTTLQALLQQHHGVDTYGETAVGFGNIS